MVSSNTMIARSSLERSSLSGPGGNCGSGSGTPPPVPIAYIAPPSCVLESPLFFILFFLEVRFALAIIRPPPTFLLISSLLVSNKPSLLVSSIMTVPFPPVKVISSIVADIRVFLPRGV